jgi:hypothetical protein
VTALASLGRPRRGPIAGPGLLALAILVTAVVHLDGPGGEPASRPHTIGGRFNVPAGWQAGDSADDPVWFGPAPHSTLSLEPHARPASEIPLGEAAVQP